MFRSCISIPSILSHCYSEQTASNFKQSKEQTQRADKTGIISEEQLELLGCILKPASGEQSKEQTRTQRADTTGEQQQTASVQRALMQNLHLDGSNNHSKIARPSGI
jgi:hypothetical protein